MALVAEPQLLFGQFVEIGEQLALPAVPDSRPDRADVDHGQHQQLAQPLEALHLGNEVEDRLRVGQVALERRSAHQQVMTHQPGDQRGFFLAQAEARAQLLGDFGPEHRVIAATALGDVVQQRGDVERAAAGELRDHLGRDRVVLGQLAALDLGEQPDRADGVLVDRVVVIHVELHLRADAAKVGHEPAEHAGLVHPAQDGFRVLAAGQQGEESGVGSWVRADLGVDALHVARDDPQRVGVDFVAVLLGQLEHLDQPHRVLLEPVVGRGGDPAAEDLVALEIARPRAEGREQPARLLLAGHLLVDMRQEHAGQVADVAGLEEVVLHETLDRALARAFGELHPRGDLALQVECQPVLGSSGDHVQVAAHREQEVLGPAEGAVLGGGQQPNVDQLGRGLHPMDVLADPVQRLQVAQAALAVLDVGFDDIAAVAHALVPLVALLELLGDELRFAARHDFAPEAPAGLVVERLVAPQVAAFEDRGADRQVLPGHPHHVVERAARMADLEAQVPQVIEDRLDHLLAPRRALGGSDEGDVDVGVRRHLAAPVAADRNQRQPLPRSAVGRGEHVGDHVVVHHADQLVDQERLALDALIPGARLLGEAAGELGAAFVELVAQEFDDFRPRLLRAALRHCVGDGFGKRAPVDHRALVGDVDAGHLRST